MDVPHQQGYDASDEETERPLKKRSRLDISAPEGVDPRKSERKTNSIDRLTYMSSLTNTTDDIPPTDEILCMEHILPHAQAEDLNPVYMMQASADPDTMYYHKAMREDDRDEFKSAMRKEWRDQSSNGNFTIVPKTKVPEGATVLPSVWAMRRKRCIRTRRIKKYKAR